MSYRFDIGPYLDRDRRQKEPKGALKFSRARLDPSQDSPLRLASIREEPWEKRLYRALDRLHSEQRGPRLESLLWRPPHLPSAQELSGEAQVLLGEKLCILARGLDSTGRDPLQFLMKRLSGMKAKDPMEARQDQRPVVSNPLQLALEKHLLDSARLLKQRGFGLGQLMLDELGERALLPSRPEIKLLPRGSYAAVAANQSGNSVPYLLQLARRGCCDVDLSTSPVRAYVIEKSEYAAARPGNFRQGLPASAEGPFTLRDLQELPAKERQGLQQAALFLNWFLPTTSDYIEAMVILYASVHHDLGAAVARDLAELGYGSYVRHSTQCLLESTARGEPYFARDFRATLPVRQSCLGMTTQGEPFFETAGNVASDRSVPFTTVLTRFEALLGITPAFVNDFLVNLEQRSFAAVIKTPLKGIPQFIPPSSAIRVAFWPEGDIVNYFVRQMLPEVYRGERPFTAGWGS